jgi:16S rRNA pseudouridine516 synthase
MSKKMHLEDILYTQGFGTRRVCAGLIEKGLVQVYDAETRQFTPTNSALASESIASAAIKKIANDYLTKGSRFRVQGVDWEYHELAYVLFNKPAGSECSQKPSMHPSIYTFLPSPLRLRPQKSAIQGVQAVGRLDQDTTGMLLMSDDGQFIHRMSSPKKHVSKVYEVTTKHPLNDKQVQKLLSGVVLDDDPKPVKAAAAEMVSEFHLKLTLTEGKYHQVKRMLAAVSNRVEGLHRSQIGGLKLPDDLLPGQWRWLSEADMALMLSSPTLSTSTSKAEK